MTYHIIVNPPTLSHPGQYILPLNSLTNIGAKLS